MVTVAERFRRKIVVLVHMGSNPICHTLIWGYSSVAEQRTVNPFVESSTLSIPAEVWPRGLRRLSAKVLYGHRIEGSNPSASASDRLLVQW